MSRRSCFSVRALVTGILFLSAVLLAGSGNTFAQTSIPKITLGVEHAQKPEDVAVTLQILFMMTILSLAPAILIMMTSFTRIIIIFHFIRQALGTPQMPANQILIGLALFMTFYIMSPVITDINDRALQPFLREELTDREALDQAQIPVRRFMLKLTGQRELALFTKYADGAKPATPDDISLKALVPAFVVSELRIAFQIGFVLYVPFLMVDMIVATVLMSMGMLMLPPVMISLPFKVLLFILVDGWYILADSALASFR